MRAIHRLFASTFLMVALAPHNSSAQEQIPKELALALMPNGAAEGAEIMVGKLPPDLAASITLPPGGRILGSFMSVAYGQSVIALPFGADSARAFVRHALTEHGWTAQEPTVNRPGGLQYAPCGAEPTIFCKDGAPLGLNLRSQFYGRETLIHLTRIERMRAQDVTLAVTKTSTPGCYQIDLRATARGPRR